MVEALIENLPPRLESALSEVLSADEPVDVKLKGAFKEGLVCTDRRVIIVKGGFMTGQVLGNNTFQLPYANITSVEIKFHFNTGYLEVTGGGIPSRDASYWSTDKKTDASKLPNGVTLVGKQKARFQQAASFIMAKMNDQRGGASSSSSVADELTKFAQLRDAGVLTEEEFAAQKAKLLG